MKISFLLFSEHPVFHKSSRKTGFQTEVDERNLDKVIKLKRILVKQEDRKRSSKK